MELKNKINQELYPLHDFELPFIGEISVEPFKNAIN